MSVGLYYGTLFASLVNQAVDLKASTDGPCGMPHVYWLSRRQLPCIEMD